MTSTYRIVRLPDGEIIVSGLDATDAGVTFYDNPNAALAVGATATYVLQAESPDGATYRVAASVSLGLQKT